MKTVVITGANRGIGLGFVKHYLLEGWKVYALHRENSNDDLVSLCKAHSTLICITLDLLDENSIQNAGVSIKEGCNGVDLLINNAGLAQHEFFGELTQQALMNSYQVNSIAPALLTQALSSCLNDKSRVIQLSSGLASISDNLSPLGNFDAYCMSKAAVNMLTRRLAFKFAEQQIVVSAISPGWVKTDMGGAEAPASVSDAVKDITSTIKSLTLNDSGRFIDELGAVIEW
jgi:NAD(P)-dependent dehydrogenase (short-subunit alcohol dehydrogenase family)